MTDTPSGLTETQRAALESEGWEYGEHNPDGSLSDWNRYWHKEGPPRALLAPMAYRVTDEDARRLARQIIAERGPRIVCLCGSTRFMDAFFAAGWELTLRGEIVLSVGVCKHADDHGAEALGQDVAERLDELHKRKIDIADYVLVLNVGGYIGESTRREIEYATRAGKPIQFLEKEADAEGYCSDCWGPGPCPTCTPQLPEGFAPGDDATPELAVELALKGRYEVALGALREICWHSGDGDAADMAERALLRIGVPLREPR